MPIEVHFEKRIINNNVIREADAKSHRDYIIVTALAAMFLFGLFAYGWQHYQWNQYGYRIEEAVQCGVILDRALETPGPVLIEAVVDPFEPPMPPKITVEQAARFAESLARGEPNRTKIALTVLRDKVKELL